MALGKRGARGLGRGKGGLNGKSNGGSGGGSGTSGVPWSQSGGIAKTFAGHGGSGGGGYSNPQATQGRVTGRNAMGNGTPIKVRDAGGDKSLKRGAGGRATPASGVARGGAKPWSKANVRKSARGRGGSNDT